MDEKTGQDGEEQKEFSALSDSDWKKRLSQEQFYILRLKGTEAPFSGKYVDNNVIGKYLCAGCGIELFHSSSKFHSGCGWPSFSSQTSDQNVGYRHDTSHNMSRTEVYCKKCGGHLGHVFEDGPAPSGKRFCINSAALQFVDETPPHSIK